MTEDIHSRLVRYAGSVCISTELEMEASACIKRLEADNAALIEKLRGIGRAARRQSVNEAASADYLRGAMQALADSSGNAIGEFIDIPAKPSELLKAATEESR